ncbi:MAG: methyltransferase domain-containing protein [Gammaproteobacteria bacterium]
MSNANQEQIDYWNDKAGPNWVAMQERLDGVLKPLSDAGLQAAQVKTAERVLDVGCGCGDTSIALHNLGAKVLGVDVSGPMLEHARNRNGDVDYLQADAATSDFGGKRFDLVFSRFGVMFFADPVAAFRNIRGAMNENGRLLFVCWQPPSANPWMSAAGKAVAPYLPAPDTPPNPRAPGPFAFAEEDYVTEILTQAGFSNVSITPHPQSLNVAATVDQAVQFQTRLGPASRAINELDGEQREAALAAVKTALSPFAQERGVFMDAAVWLVSAEA